MDENGNTQALIEFCKDAVAGRTVPIGQGREVILVPEGQKLMSLKPLLDEYRDKPERIKGMARFSELQSLIDHINLFKGDSSMVFCDRTSQVPSITAVFDYHARGAPDWTGHSAVYAFPLDPCWQQWMAKVDREQSQHDLCVFLEDHVCELRDAANPGIRAQASELEARYRLRFSDPTTVSQAVRELWVRTSSEAKSAVNIQNGDVRVAYTVESKAGIGTKTVEVPTAFLLEVPLFRAGAKHLIPVRLRYRAEEGKVFWTLSLVRADLVMDAAILEVIETLKDGTKLPVLLGTPEK
jgi:uncharacterized protein YfdQ (DUF2303 family)